MLPKWNYKRSLSLRSQFKCCHLLHQERGTSVCLRNMCMSHWDFKGNKILYICTHSFNRMLFSYALKDIKSTSPNSWQKRRRQLSRKTLVPIPKVKAAFTSAIHATLNYPLQGFKTTWHNCPAKKTCCMQVC